MGASDYMVGNAPSGMSYSAGLVDFSPLADIGKSYQQGQQYQRQRELQKPILGPDGQPTTDMGTITQELLKRGGAEYAKELLPFLQKQQVLQQGQDQPGLQNQPLPNGQQFAPQPQAQAPQPSVQSRPLAPSSNEGTNPTTLANVIQSQVKDPAVAGRVIAAASGKLGIDAGQPVDPNNPTLKAYIASANGGVIPSGGTAGQPPQQMAQAPQATQQSQPMTAAGAMVPPQYRDNPQVFSQMLRDQADQIRKNARREGIVGIPSKASEDAAAARDARANKIDEAIAEQNKLTPEGRNARDPAVMDFEAKKGMQTADIKHSEALFSGIQSLGNSSAGMLDNVKLQKDLTNNPDFYSGPAEKAALFLKRAVPSFAGSAAPMELYQKVLNNNMLHMVDNMKAAAQEMGSSSSRIFTAQIQQIEKASGTLDNSPTGLRALAELTDRTLRNHIQVADFATAYKQGNAKALPEEFTRNGPPQRLGMIDDNFERGLRDWMSAHPILSQQESTDPRVLGAPTFKTPAEAHSAGLKKGDPVRTPDGRIVYAP